MKSQIGFLRQNQFILISAENAASVQMLELVAASGIRGRVQVIDVGNHFNVYKLAKHIRRRTISMEKTLRQIKISRCFNCYQTVTQICENISSDTPILVLDLLYTFYDEDISLKESKRLLQKVLKRFDVLCKTQPVIVSVKPPKKLPERFVLLEMLRNQADIFLELEKQTSAIPKQLNFLPENPSSIRSMQ